MSVRSKKNPDPIDQPIKLGTHWVPGVWRYMLPDALTGMNFPEERRSTCLNCPRARFEQWRPDYRCCTYHPRVPNFLLGLALTVPESAKIVTRLARDGFLMPEGMISSPNQWAFYLSDTAEDRFGRSEKVLCPFLERHSGLCNLYAFRNSVCSTFFCYHDHGDQGDRFWSSLQTVAQQVEMAIGQWALDELGFDVKAYMKRLNSLSKKIQKVSDPETGAWSPAARKIAWGKYYGRELELLSGCADLVRKNRNELWEIANRIEILEPHKFDRAAVKVVPRKYRSEIDDDYYDTGETSPPRDIWRGLTMLHKNLWKSPEGTLQLSPRARININIEDDDEAKAKKHLSHVVEFRTRRNSVDYEWREYVSQDEALALLWFKRRRNITQMSIDELSKLVSRDPETFIREWRGKKVLTKTN